MSLIPEVRTAIVQAAERQARQPRRPRTLIRPRAFVAGGGVALAAAVAGVLILSATSGTSPAYALTIQPDGTFTLSIYSLTSDIPQLNAKLAQVGIDETVVPVTSSCTNQFPIYDAGSVTTMTLYAGRKYLAPGTQGVIAAEALPNGHVALVQGALSPADIPSCFATLEHTQITIIPGPTTSSGNTGNTGTG